MILAVANQKGGTAKSTTAAALAQAAAHKGRRVLVIDTDPQANASFFLAADVNRPGAFEVLEGLPAAEAIQATADGLDVIPASWNLQTISSSRGSARRLKTALEPIAGGYDLIILDTPPTAGELQYNALMAATDLIIPLQADIVGLQGLYQMADTARQIQGSNPDLSIIGVILTRYDSRPKINRYLQEVITEKGQEIGAPFLMSIRSGIAIREAQALQQSLFEYAPHSKPAQDYKKLFTMIQEA